VIIIDNGIIVANEVKSNIYSMLRQPKQVIQIEFDKDISEIALPGNANIRKIRKIKSNIWVIEAEGDEDIRPMLFNFAVNNGLTVLSLQRHENNLEEVFRHLTNG
jgi:ABC-2 type transport system ATP-binding protein